MNFSQRHFGFKWQFSTEWNSSAPQKKTEVMIQPFFFFFLINFLFEWKLKNVTLPNMQKSTFLSSLSLSSQIYIHSLSLSLLLKITYSVSLTYTFLILEKMCFPKCLSFGRSFSIPVVRNCFPFDTLRCVPQ